MDWLGVKGRDCYYYGRGCCDRDLGTDKKVVVVWLIGRYGTDYYDFMRIRGT